MRSVKRLRDLTCLVIGVVAVAGCTLASVAPPTATTSVPRQAKSAPIYLNPAYPPAERAADLVSRMTTAEKAEEMDSSEAPAIPSLGVAAWGWWNEANHGVSYLTLTSSGNAKQLYNTTTYPTDLALGSTWNFYAPTVNLSRDPRWGRNDETWSEDPILTADLASQYVDGLQGENSNGQLPASAHGYYQALATLETYGFGGYFTSDCDAIYVMQAFHNWIPPNSTVPANQYTRSAYANSAGEDLECNAGYQDSNNYGNTIPTALTQNIQTLTDTYNIGDVDTSLVRLFTARIETGEFDTESQVPWVAKARAALGGVTWTSNPDSAITETPQRLRLTQDTADQGIVLLIQTGPGAANNVDAYGGIKAAVEKTEGNDRTSLAVPGAQASMISADPSGHLPFTWYANQNQLPPVTDYTVSLSDHSLVGYVTKGQSTSLPEGMTVTITATVRYHGATATGSVVVDVR